jgi:beta-lactamase class A
MTELLAGLQASSGDSYAVVLEDIRSGEQHTLNAERVFPSGSVYKLPLAWEVLRQVDAGQLSLDDVIEIQAEDTIEPEPYGGFGAGDTPTLREALSAMLSVSSNTTAHALLRMLGRDAVNSAMQDLGLRQTRVPQDVADDQDQDAGATGAVTSAADIARVLRLLVLRQGLSPTAHDLMIHCLGHARGPDSLRDTVPDDVIVLDKTGNLRRSSNVGALLVGQNSTVILVVLDEDVDPGAARGQIARLGLAARDAYLQPPD